MKITIGTVGKITAISFPPLTSPEDSRKLGMSLVMLITKWQASRATLDKNPFPIIELVWEDQFPNTQEIMEVLKDIFLEEITVQEPSL
ncbi:MAG: hypothetical protein NTW73_01070 [Candidatus Parcubacteria bacterium]|nr:hypothetical protein [Candidatus Parcubacteria bacterium]